MLTMPKCSKLTILSPHCHRCCYCYARCCWPRISERIRGMGIRNRTDSTKHWVLAGSSCINAIWMGWPDWCKAFSSSSNVWVGTHIHIMFCWLIMPPLWNHHAAALLRQLMPPRVGMKQRTIRLAFRVPETGRPRFPSHPRAFSRSIWGEQQKAGSSFLRLSSRFTARSPSSSKFPLCHHHRAR